MPGNPTYGELLGHHYKGLADSHIRLKDHAKAVNAAGRLARVRPDAADDPYRAARVLGRCVELAEHDPAFSAARRTELARTYADEAMDDLREAVRRGFSSVEPLKISGAFAPLRGRPDFQQLLKELTRR